MKTATATLILAAMGSLVVLAPACSSSEGDCDKGSEACACRDDGTCDSGLECRSDLCVSGGGDDTGGTGGGGDTTGEGGSGTGLGGRSSGTGGRSSGTGGSSSDMMSPIRSSM